MRSRQELLEASGYSRQPAEFEDLLHVLNTELRLVTPADPEGVEEWEREQEGEWERERVEAPEKTDEPAPPPSPAATLPPSPAPTPSRFYQLTHDYLVPALRGWLTRKQQETWRGRAELLLEERAAAWAPKRENRLLPSLPEYAFLRLGVRRRQWKPEQRALMRAAAKRHGLHASLVLLVVLAAGLLVQRYIASVNQAADAQSAATLVGSVLNASPAEVPAAISRLEPYANLARPLLRSRFDSEPAESIQKLHAAFALAGLGEVEEAYLIDRIPKVPGSETPNLIAALAAAKESAVPALLQRVGQELDDPQTRARYAIALLHLSDPRGAGQVLALVPGPKYRTAFIHTFSTWHGELRPLPALLRQIKTPGFQSGLCAALGLVPVESLALDEHGSLKDALVDLYRDADDGGTHSAAGWALRKWQEDLPVLKCSSEHDPQHPNRKWFVNSHQMTMLRVNAGNFRMGYPDKKEWGRPHDVKLTQSFYVCDREVWADLFEQFVKDPDWPEAEKPVDWRGFSEPSVPKPDCAASGLSWYDAIRFCNWLSKKEGRNPCYTRSKNGAVGKGAGHPETWEWKPGANGYRLPTEAEWEYTCRAGSTTPYFFGVDPNLLPFYAFFPINSDAHAWPGGTKLPNAWGLFDTHGNVDEWCWDWYGPDDAREKIDPRGPPTGTMRVNRGGDWLSPLKIFLRSDYRTGMRAEPGHRFAPVGLRPVFTAATADPPAEER
jgi:formylglycine-generating enzyme required for sulfatase activity